MRAFHMSGNFNIYLNVQLNIYFIMASKTITITEEVYQLLKLLKKQDESFSELLRRLALSVNGQKLEHFFGSWDLNDQEYKKIKEEIKLNLIPFNGKKRRID